METIFNLKGDHSDLMRRYMYHIAFLCFSLVTLLREGAQLTPPPLGAAVEASAAGPADIAMLRFVLGIFRWTQHLQGIIWTG